MKYLLFILLLPHILLSQHLISSNTEIRTCLNQTQCASFSNIGYLFFDERKNEFYLKIDFSRLNTLPATEEWLLDLKDTSFYFKAHFEKSDFPQAANHDSKSYRLNGQLLLNHIWHNETIDMTILSSENSILNPSGTGNEYEVYKVNFSMKFSPKDFKIDEKPHHLKNPIYIAVTQGRINLLEPGMEHLLGEAYNHN
jgi:hypothetical protein